MNATTFYCYDDFFKIREMAKKEQKINFDGFCRKVKISGNWYQLEIYSLRYYDSDEYHVSCNISYNFKCDKLSDGRDIGGGNYVKVDLKDYQSFCKGINDSLCEFPDYDGALQMTLF